MILTLRAVPFLFAFLLVLPNPASATRPCPPHPCLDETRKLLEAECRKAADWIATGTISKVAHDRQGHPLNTDFASFTFTPNHWEKGEKQGVSSIDFKVGWCQNPTNLPGDTSGTFKFYGLNSPTHQGGSQFLHFHKAP